MLSTWLGGTILNAFRDPPVAQLITRSHPTSAPPASLPVPAPYVICPGPHSHPLPVRPSAYRFLLQVRNSTLTFPETGEHLLQLLPPRRPYHASRIGPSNQRYHYYITTEALKRERLLSVMTSNSPKTSINSCSPLRPFCQSETLSPSTPLSGDPWGPLSFLPNISYPVNESGVL